MCGQKRSNPATRQQLGTRKRSEAQRCTWLGASAARRTRSLLDPIFSDILDLPTLSRFHAPAAVLATDALLRRLSRLRCRRRDRLRGSTLQLPSRRRRHVLRHGRALIDCALLGRGAGESACVRCGLGVCVPHDAQRDTRRVRAPQ